VPIGANPENFSTKKESQFRDDYNLSSDTTVILFCGQFIHRKGVDDIIDVLPELPSSNIEYIFIGHGGDLENELQKATNSKQSPANTKVYTELDTETLRKWYVIADLFLLPSYAEGRPTVIYEAMAAETAVLSTLIDGVSEQVVPGETGQLIKPGDKNKLIEKIRHMASNKHDLSKMGKNGKERLISNHWTWHDHADKIVNIHSKLLGSVT
jgi:glycosyltransferase involved in cell wall biosynthesis